MIFRARRSRLLASVAAFGLLVLRASFIVHAQSNAPPAIAPAPRLTLTAEQEYIIREIIFKDTTVQKENAAPEMIGDVVPDSVKLYPLPPEITQKCRKCDPTCSLFVSSSDRRIADVIKKKPTD